MRILFAAILAGLCVSAASAASAATIYDEAVDADAGGVGAPLDLGTLAEGETSTILFTLTEGSDEQDVFQFQLTQTATLDYISPSAPNDFTFEGYRFSGCCGGLTNATNGLPGLDPIPPGIYTIINDMTTGFGPVYAFQIDINVAPATAVPAPGGGLLLLGGLGLAGLIRRNRAGRGVSR